VIDGAALLIGLAIAVLAAAFVLRPLLREEGGPAGQTEANLRLRLETAYRHTLDTIRDLDFDFQTGKVLEADYRAWRERYAAQGAALLRTLDENGTRPPLAHEQALSDKIEALVRARRAPTLERVCPACRRPCRPGDRFCGKCGISLEEGT